MEGNDNVHIHAFGGTHCQLSTLKSRKLEVRWLMIVLVESKLKYTD